MVRWRLKEKILKLLGIRKRVKTPWLPTEQKIEELYQLLQKSDTGLSCENWDDLRNIARSGQEANAIIEGDVLKINGIEWTVVKRDVTGR